MLIDIFYKKILKITVGVCPNQIRWDNIPEFIFIYGMQLMFFFRM